MKSRQSCAPPSGAIMMMAYAHIVNGGSMKGTNHRNDGIKLLDACPPRAAIKSTIVRTRSREILRFSSTHGPRGRFKLRFTSKHGFLLDLVEGIFSKLARSALRHIQATSIHRLKERTAAVGSSWSYELTEAVRCDFELWKRGPSYPP